ncbi:hypothetical protein FRC12_008160 [Ceratobasidium sp. 428]|nr:hypothetical protein FRC12_008160 [Ceratobasidium sp. 428]
MIWKSTATWLMALMPSFPSPILSAQTRPTRDSYLDPNLCGNIDLKGLGYKFLSNRDYGTTRCICLERIPILLAKPDFHLELAVLRFGAEGAYRRLEDLKLMVDVCVRRGLKNVVNFVALWKAITWSKPHSNDSPENPNTATGDVNLVKNSVVSPEPKMDGNA